MSAPSIARVAARSVPADREPAAASVSRVGVWEWMLAAWIFLEFAKPLQQTFRIPLLISAVLLLVWLSRVPKRWPRQIVCTLAFVVVMAIHVPLARNNFSAFWSAYYMTVTLVICCAIVQFVDSMIKIRFLVNTLILAFVVIGGWAATHGGFGPLGASAGQDENYVGQAMAVGIPLAFFSIFIARSWLLKLGCAGAVVVFTTASIVGFSRGAFLGLCTVGLYCWLRSPRKLLSSIIAALLALLLVRLTPEDYWAEMRTIEAETDASTDLRIDLWKIAWWMFLDHPVAGVGPGNYRWNSGDYQSAEQLEAYDRSFAGVYVVHSLYFELLAEMGLIGALVVGTLLATDFRDKRRIARMTREHGDSSPALRDARYLEMGLTGSMLGFLVCTAFLSNLYGPFLWILAMLTAALRASTESVVFALHPPAEAEGSARAGGALATASGAERHG